MRNVEGEDEVNVGREDQLWSSIVCIQGRHHKVTPAWNRYRSAGRVGAWSEVVCPIVLVTETVTWNITRRKTHVYVCRYSAFSMI